MRHLHVEPFCGAAGDMLLAALVDSGLVSLERVVGPLRGLGLGNWRIEATRVRRGALAATLLVVDTTGAPSEHHRDLATIQGLIRAAALAPRVEERACAAFIRLAEAEAAVHGIPVDEVHFHEVGAVDAVLDIVGFCVALEELDVATVSCGSWRVGRGSTDSAHGMIPVPSPATVALARGFVVEDTGIPHELFTPTAAALMAALATPARVAPAFELEASGAGAGSRDLAERPNVCRVSLGRRASASTEPADREDCVLLEANLDDQSPEEIAYALECAREAGALDAWATPAVFKKGRAGVVASVLVHPGAQAAVEVALLRETSTLGVRATRVDRLVLARELVTVETEHGPVQVKLARDASGVLRNVAPEFESAAALARSTGVSLKEIMAAARRAASVR